MVIFRNIPGLIKFYSGLRHLTVFKKEIADARAKNDYQREQANILLATKSWGTKMLASVGVKVNVAGKENLPTKGPVVYIANHQGFADIVAMCSVLDTVQFGFISKKSLAKVPLYGKWIDLVRSVLIERDNPRDSLRAINKGVALIEQGYSMAIFPEGTRSRSSQMGEFKRGATRLATKPGVPIIPISINGSYRVMEETGVVSPATMDLVIHPAIETSGLSREEERGLSDVVEKIIRDGVLSLVDNPLS